MSIENPIKDLLERKSFVVGKELLRENEIPSIAVYGKTLPEAWENAVLATWEYGTGIPTEYDASVDPESRDATVMITVTDPFAEPRIHKAIPGGFNDLAKYTAEVVGGIHDHWVRDGGWSYSYHDRLFNWPGVDSWNKLFTSVGIPDSNIDFDLPGFDQINDLINKLSEAPHSRRAQATTWVPFIDGRHHEPPCLQRIWCRIVKSEDIPLLEMNTHWRSRDAFKAAYMNMFALTVLQKSLAKRISDISGREIGVGRYIDVSDSFHIYGQYIRKGEMDKFIRNVIDFPVEKRFVDSRAPVVNREFERGIKELEAEKNAGERD